MEIVSKVLMVVVVDVEVVVEVEITALVEVEVVLVSGGWDKQADSKSSSMTIARYLFMVDYGIARG